MSVLELIDTKASQLPPELQVEVLDFIEFLGFKKAKTQAFSTDSFPHLPNKFGAGKGVISYIAEDFDAPSTTSKITCNHAVTDRMLIAQAQTEKLTVMTQDSNFPLYDLTLLPH